MHKLSPHLTLGAVNLNVEHLEKMKNFYTKVLRLDILSDTPIRVELGINKKPLLILHHRVDLAKAHPRQAGLYHFAIVYASRGELARTVYNVLRNTPELFSGSADHLVSEAFYFNDPEGNGIELYYDRERSTWQWENGYVKMATLYIDPADYIERYIDLKESNNADMGHVHLKVGDIAKARQFYVDILGFDVTAEIPNALFISVGGYHHHIGMNTWESAGAEKRNESHGLKSFEFILPTAEEIGLLKQKLEEHAIAMNTEKGKIEFIDPWNNKIIAKTL